MNWTLPAPHFVPLHELLVQGRGPAHPVALSGSRTRSWEELSQLVQAWRQGLLAAGVRRMALFEQDGFQFAGALLGAWAAGVEVVLPGDALPQTCAELLPQVEAFAGEFPADLPRVGKATGPSVAPPEGWKGDPQAIAVSLFTSGSTGKKEKFSKRLAQLEAELECLEATFGRRLGPAAVLSTVSHQHIYGLLFKILWPLCAGRPFVARTLFFPEELPAAAHRGSSLLVSSPAHLRRLPDSLEGMGEVNWRAVFSSGGPLAQEGGLRTRALFAQWPLEVYGSTETGGIAWREKQSDSSAWQLFSDVEISLGPDQRLSVRSPKLAEPSWFHTQDRAGQDREGHLVLLGRQDRIVKVEGKRLSLDALEAALLETGWVGEAKVVPLALERDTLGAVVTAAAAAAGWSRRELEQKLREALAQRVERVGIPRRFRVVEALPQDAQGKTTLAGLVGLFEEKVDGVKVPEILERKGAVAGKASLKLRLPERLRYFQGHFPQTPLLPGVVQVEWAQRYGKELLGVTGEFRGMEVVKFQKVLQPGDEVELRLEYLPERGRLKFEYQSDRGTHSRGVLLFGRSHV